MAGVALALSPFFDDHNWFKMYMDYNVRFNFRRYMYIKKRVKDHDK